MADTCSSVKQLVKELIDSDDVVIFSKTTCPFCIAAKKVFDDLHQVYTAVELNKRDDGDTIQTILEQITGARTVPRVFVRGECLGGCSDIKELYASGKLVEILKAK
ncbi:glutaredoxin-C4-like isoform X2 [Zootermopsis nevadensis]|nr:glutaredoxin-C4-like isoform X2 [Zootermopsis nevadensis]